MLVVAPVALKKPRPVISIKDSYSTLGMRVRYERTPSVPRLSACALIKKFPLKFVSGTCHEVTRRRQFCRTLVQPREGTVGKK